MRNGHSRKVRNLGAAGALLTAICAAGTIAGGPAMAEDKPTTASRRLDTGIYTLPSRMCGPYFLIPLKMPAGTNGDGRVLTFLLDTGARISSVDPDSIPGRKAKAGGRVDLVNARAGPLTFRRLAASARHLDNVSKRIGEPLDGVLGFTAFRNFLLTLDYRAGRVRVSRGALPRPDGREIFNAEGPDLRPFLEIDVGGKKRRVLIDTASAATFGLRTGKNPRWRAAPVPVSAFMGANRLELRKAGRLGTLVRIGAHRLKEPLVYPTTDQIEVMGGGALRHFEVTFDFKHQRVRLQRPRLTPIEMPSLRATGAMLRQRPGGLQVVTVLKGTPAEEAGLRAGDLIVATDGRDATKGTCPHSASGEGEGDGTVRYEVRRGRDTVTLDVRKAVLVK